MLQTQIGELQHVPRAAQAVHIEDDEVGQLGQCCLQSLEAGPGRVLPCADVHEDVLRLHGRQAQAGDTLVPLIALHVEAEPVGLGLAAHAQVQTGADWLVGHRITAPFR